MTSNLKKHNYKFDEKLTSQNIRYITSIAINKDVESFLCDRCNKELKNVYNTIKIDETNYYIGDDCYASVKAKLSLLRGKSIVNITREIEKGHEAHYQKHYPEYDPADETDYKEDSIDKYDPDYKLYMNIKWDAEHGHLPKHRIEEYDRLKNKYEGK